MYFSLTILGILAVLLKAWPHQELIPGLNPKPHRQQPGQFKNADAVHVLAFSVILLNTDLHNSTVRPPLLLARTIFLCASWWLMLGYHDFFVHLSVFCTQSDSVQFRS